MDFYPLEKWIYSDEEVTVSIFVSWKWSRHVDALADKWCATFVHPTYFFFGWCGWFIPLADRATLHAINYIHMHTWPPIRTMEGAKQLVPPTMPKGIIGVR